MPRNKPFSHITTSILVFLGLSCINIGSKALASDDLAPWVGTMLNGAKCDGGRVPYGPFDYLQRNRFPGELAVVEDNHFNADVESLTKGMSSSAMGDIHYTLLTWPNHHRALKSAFRFRLQDRETWTTGNNTNHNYPAECYLQRAIHFSPNDPIPYILHGMLMHQMRQYESALKSYRKAVQLRPDDLVTQYNMGLTLVELKKYPEAQQIAAKVYAADFPLPGLKRKLEQAKRPKAKARVAPANTNTAATTAGNAASGESAATPTPPPLSSEQSTKLEAALKNQAAKGGESSTEATE